MDVKDIPFMTQKRRGSGTGSSVTREYLDLRAFVRQRQTLVIVLSLFCFIRSPHEPLMPLMTFPAELFVDKDINGQDVDCGIECKLHDVLLDAGRGRVQAPDDKGDQKVSKLQKGLGNQ